MLAKKCQDLLTLAGCFDTILVSKREVRKRAFCFFSIKISSEILSPRRLYKQSNGTDYLTLARVSRLIEEGPHIFLDK